jgi:hypothetical protein
MEISKKELETIIKISFKIGQEWGCHYSTWFTPTEEAHNEKIESAIETIFSRFSIKQGGE